MTNFSDSVVNRHDAVAKAFTVGAARLEYRLLASPPKVLEIYRTFVPSELRGKKIADRMAEACFEYAKENQFAIRPSCSFISSTFLERNPQWSSIIELPSKL